MNAVTMISYWTILHQISPNCYFGIIKLVAVHSIQDITNDRSVMARLTMRLFVFDLIVFFFSITTIISEFPIKPKMPIIAKNNGINILMIFLHYFMLEVKFILFIFYNFDCELRATIAEYTDKIYAHCTRHSVDLM